MNFFILNYYLKRLTFPHTMDLNQKQATVICEISRGTLSTLYYVEMADRKYALKVLTTQDSQHN